MHLHDRCALGDSEPRRSLPDAFLSAPGALTTKSGQMRASCEKEEGQIARLMGGRIPFGVPVCLEHTLHLRAWLIP